MKALYWNIRGIANSPSILALKRLIKLHSPDFVFIAEPWMNFDSFPPTWLHRLDYKLFFCNSRTNKIPNLWWIFLNNLNPIVNNVDDQQVTFSCTMHNQVIFLSAIYAFTSNLKRKELWQKLSFLQVSLNGPCCYIGDFNSILGAHKHNDFLSPTKPLMEDFLN